MDLKPGELLTDIVIRYEDYAGYSGRYIKYAIRNAMDITILGCCAAVRLSADKTTLSDIRLSFAAAGPLPMRARKTEDALWGRQIGPELPVLIGALAPTQDVSPIGDKRASREFRLHLIGELSKDALTSAIIIAGGEIGA
jgi:xanthine dehydrogenase FAD-binding subunit